MTHLDFAILGLVHQSPLTGYEVRKVFETTALGNYSSSPGTIYPALKRLQKLKMLIQKESDSNRKLFFITGQGEKELTKWLIKPIEKDDIAKRIQIILLRFAFMEDLVEKDEKILFLQSFRDELKKYIKELKDYYQKEGKTMKLHGRLAFEHGIESYQMDLRWVQKTLRKINEK
jgi:DNA-binding PadR family transcriptional regulator